MRLFVLLLAFALVVWMQSVTAFSADPVAVQTPISAPTNISTRTEWKRIGSFDYLYVYVSYTNPDDDRITFNSVRYRPKSSNSGWSRNNQTTPGDDVRVPFGTHLPNLPGGTWEFQVAAGWGGNNFGVWSPLDTFIAAVIPSAPTKPTVTGGHESVTLSANVGYDGGTDITKWQYTYKTNGDYGSWKDISSTSKSLKHTVSGLTNGTSYQFKMRAVNGVGESAESPESEAVEPVAATLAVTGHAIDDTKATLMIDNHLGDWYYKANTAPDTSCSSVVSSGTTTASLTNLSANTPYIYSAYSDSACKQANLLSTASTYLTKPGKPTKPVVSSGVGTGQLVLNAMVTGSGLLTKWQYQQKSGGSFGSWQNISSTSTRLSHTVSGLIDGTSYQFKVRAVNASGDGMESDASDEATPTVVTLTVTAHTTDNSRATLTIGSHSGDWYYKANAAPDTSCSSVVSSGTTINLTNLSANTFYIYRAYSDSTCTAVNLLATTTFLTEPDTAANVSNIQKQVVVDSLAATAWSLLSSVDMALVSRLRGELDEGMTVAGYALPLGSVRTNHEGMDHRYAYDPDREVRVESLDWLAGTSFVVPLYADSPEAHPGKVSGLTLWGRGDIQSFRAQRSSVDGEIRTAYIGLDTGQSDDGLLGAALSHSRGDTDFAYESSGGSGSGRLRTSLTAVHPYLRWRVGDNGTLWTILGLGRGRIEDQRADSSERGDLSMFMVSFGGRHDLSSPGQVDLALLGDAAFLGMKSKTDSQQGVLDDLSSSMRRLRFGLEGSYDVRMDRGVLSPFGQVGAHYDKGDGETGSGAAVAGGIRYYSNRLILELGGRALRTGGGDYREHGWNVGFELAPREFGEGLSLSLSPSWGKSQRLPLEALWHPDALSTVDTASDTNHGPEIKAKIGYGFRWQSSPALLTPYAEHNRLASGARRLRLGVDMRLKIPSTRFELDLRGELDQSPHGKDERKGIFLDALLHF